MGAVRESWRGHGGGGDACWNGPAARTAITTIRTFRGGDGLGPGPGDGIAGGAFPPRASADRLARTGLLRVGGPGGGGHVHGGGSISPGLRVGGIHGPAGDYAGEGEESGIVRLRRIAVAGGPIHWDCEGPPQRWANPSPSPWAAVAASASREQVNSATALRAAMVRVRLWPPASDHVGARA
jgi:hypothetical protein